MNELMTFAFAIALAWWGTTDAEPVASSQPRPTGSAVVGALRADGHAEGSLVATPDGFAFHAFVVDVPPDVVRWTLELDADADLDLALRFGAMGAAPSGPRPGRDWDRFDIGTDDRTVLTLVRPRPGRWFVVVVAPLEPGARGTYVLTSRVERGATVDAGVAGTYRCRESGALLHLHAEDDGRITGTLEGPRTRYGVDAVATADGAYGSIWDATGRIGFLALSAPAGLAVVMFELDEESRAIEEGAWWVYFDRVGEDAEP